MSSMGWLENALWIVSKLETAGFFSSSYSTVVPESVSATPQPQAPGSAGEAGPACLRVDRGSSWFYSRWMLRSAVRERNPADYRDIVLGFRVANTLP